MASHSKPLSPLIKRFRAREFLLSNSQSPARSISSPVTLPNPFLPNLNHETGKWTPPRYSLRRQAELIKHAKVTGALSLLPPGTKNPNTSNLKYKVHHKADTSSPIINLLLNPPSPSLSNNSAVLSPAIEVLREKYPIQWTGEPKVKESFGLYGKRKAMFKGHKWEKEAVIRRNLTAQVLANLEATKRNMAWGRKRRSKKPTKKVPW